MCDVHGFDRSSHHEPKEIVQRLYAPKEEYIWIAMHPLMIENRKPIWEDWHSYRSFLRIYETDFDRLLKPYFDQIFPVVHPFDHSIQACFDLCFTNWIDQKSWELWMDLIDKDLDKKSKEEQVFYQMILTWVEKVLTFTNVIVVEGNQ